jgi:hypothetical protein
MGYRQLKKDVIDQFVELLKKKKNLPYKITMNKCPERKKTCSKHHGEIVVTSFDKRKKKFHLKYYGIHTKGIKFQYDQKKDFVFELIYNGVISKKHLITVNELIKKAKLDLKKSFYRTQKLTISFSDSEFATLSRKASKKNLSVYEYCRSKLIY